MDRYNNEKGELVIIKDMDNFRLINAIAKYSQLEGKDSILVKSLKAEAVNRLSALEVNNNA